MSGADLGRRPSGPALELSKLITSREIGWLMGIFVRTASKFPQVAGFGWLVSVWVFEAESLQPR